MASAEAGQSNSGRTVIRETMSPNGVEDIGSERCIRDFDNLFTVFHPYYAEVRVSTFYVILYYHICFLLTESTYDLLKKFFGNG